MLAKLLLAALPLLAGLALLGGLLDAGPALGQTALWGSLQLASLGGMGLGLAAVSPRARAPRERGLFVLAAVLAWRLAYFPIMVFSGHVASIGEWGLAASGLPIFVYPFFLLVVAALHGAAAGLACLLVAPPHRAVRWVGAGAFFVAACVSFNQPGDLRPLPDTAWTLDEPVPAMRAEAGNPYRPALTAPGYWPNQRVVLLAAALTYDTIPPSPWATTVKAVLEGLFHERPHGSTRDRVVEHYRAYHAAHPLIGCRRLEECAAFQPAGP